MIILIVVWHTRLFGGLEVLNFAQYCDHSIPISNIICIQFLLLAVPVFFLISIFLFIANLEKTKNYFYSRIEKLLYLYFFWTGIYCLICYHKGFSIFTEVFSQSPKDIFFFIACGGVSAFWFLFSLIILTLFAYLCVGLPNFLLAALLIITTCLLWVMPIIGITQNPRIYYWVQWWVPLIHLPYVFIAVLVHRNFKSARPDLTKIVQIAIMLLVIYIVSSICEWKWIVYRCNAQNFGQITAYARISVVAGASLLFVLSFLIKQPANKLITFFSRYSLGIYCMHIFVMIAFTQLFPPIKYKFIYTSAILIVSILAAYIFRRMIQKGLI
jgi:hypothetical protein